MTPLVTVGLPVYNAEAYLAECLESIKAQTLENFEVIAVLDCPTDRSAEILRQRADSRFRIIENPRNLGLAGTCNRILEACETELLARMDSDDVMHPERLRKQYEFMQTHPETDILGTYCVTIDRDGNKIADPFPLGTTADELREDFRLRCAIYHPSVMFRAPRIMALGGYPDSRVAEDLILWLRALAAGYKFANLPEPLLQYRVHSDGQMLRTLETSLQANDAAYAEFGPRIWGDRAPDYVGGLTRWHRARRRLKRNLSRLFTK